MRNPIAILLLLSACAPLSSDPPEKPFADPTFGPAALAGADSEVEGDANDVEKSLAPPQLTWFRWTGDQHVLQDGIDCALGRLRAATCLNIDVSYEPAHWFRLKPQSGMPNPSLLGYSWGANFGVAQSMIREDLAPQKMCDVMVHEASHLLRRSNGHVGTGASADPLPPAPVLIDAPMLDAICALQSCGCFVPE